MTESEGFLVQSRWGIKLHKPECPCGVCKSRRRAAYTELQSDRAPDDPTQAQGSNTHASQLESAEHVASPVVLARKHRQMQRGVSTAPAAFRPAGRQGMPGTAVKSAMKGRLCMELMALGTPEMPLSGGRVPRQAATAAKAAIKKDLLEQNRRVGAAPLSMAIPPAAADKLTAIAMPATAAKQSCVKQKKQAKRKVEQDLEVAADSPAGPEAEPLQLSQQAEETATARSAKSMIDNGSGKSGSSHKSRVSTVVQHTHKSPPLSLQQETKFPEHSSKTKVSSRATKRQKTQQHDAADAVLIQADAVADMLIDTTDKFNSKPKLQSQAAPQRSPKASATRVGAVAISADSTVTKSDQETKPQPSPDATSPDATTVSMAASAATASASGGATESKGTATADSAQTGATSTQDGAAATQSAQQILSPAELLAQQVRTKAGWGPAVDVNVRSLMASGLLAGQPVHIQLKHREPVFLQGKVQPNGMVRCAMYVGGPVNHECSLSEFEKLGASKERRPGENVHLTNFSLALKDFAALINDIGESARSRCMVCNKGAGVIKCKGCSIAAHPQCVELTSRQQQANWFCKECKASGQDKLPQRGPDLPARARAPTRPPARPHSAPATAPTQDPARPQVPKGKPHDTSCVSPAGRVHMAVPVSGMTPARRERNGNKHKRLFLGGEGALTNGEPVVYKTSQHGILLAGEVRISPGSDANTGILCECCKTVISCSKFEAHAGQGSRRAPYDNIFTADGVTLRARAAQLPPLTEEEGQLLAMPRRRASGSRHRNSSGPLSGIADGCRDVIHDLDHDAGGCCVCGRPDFALGEFCDRTMILCDQCEREFHVGCLRRDGRCDLTQLPTGDWFCSGLCNSIWDSLNSTVAARLTRLHPPAYPPGYSIQMLRGRADPDSPCAEETNAAIDIAQNVLQESFDPIIDKATKENLLLLMTKAEVKGEYDYRGMYTALLSHEGRPVCAAVMRAFGAQLAEVPLVATKADARRQGHCRVLMQAFEAILKQAGVRLMCLPAAHETVQTWIQGFGLSRMPLDDLDSACKELRLLIFPGTQVLQKQLLPPLQPTPSLPTDPPSQADPVQANQHATPSMLASAVGPATIEWKTADVGYKSQPGAALHVGDDEPGLLGSPTTQQEPAADIQAAQLLSGAHPDVGQPVEAGSTTDLTVQAPLLMDASFVEPPTHDQQPGVPEINAPVTLEDQIFGLGPEHVPASAAEQPAAEAQQLDDAATMRASALEGQTPAEKGTCDNADEPLEPMDADQIAAADEAEMFAAGPNAVQYDTAATVHARQDCNQQAFVSQSVHSLTQEAVEPLQSPAPCNSGPTAGNAYQLPRLVSTEGHALNGSTEVNDLSYTASPPSSLGALEDSKADAPHLVLGQQPTATSHSSDSAQHSTQHQHTASDTPAQLPAIPPAVSLLPDELVEDAHAAGSQQQTESTQEHQDASSMQVAPAAQHQHGHVPVSLPVLPDAQSPLAGHQQLPDNGKSAPTEQLSPAAETAPQATQDSAPRLRLDPEQAEAPAGPDNEHAAAAESESGALAADGQTGLPSAHFADDAVQGWWVNEEAAPAEVAAPAEQALVLPDQQVGTSALRQPSLDLQGDAAGHVCLDAQLLDADADIGSPVSAHEGLAGSNTQQKEPQQLQSVSEACARATPSVYAQPV